LQALCVACEAQPLLGSRLAIPKHRKELVQFQDAFHHHETVVTEIMVDQNPTPKPS
jgi:hypothetical protein